MYYQLLIYNIFTDLSISDPDSEHDKSRHKLSPAYAGNEALIDEYIALDTVFTNLVLSVGKMTKFINSVGDKQIVQIECSGDDADLFRGDARLARFNELRGLVGFGILKYSYVEFSSFTSLPTTTFTSFNEAMAALL